MDCEGIAEATDAEDDSAELDISQLGKACDVGDGTGYMDGEEDAEDYEEPINETVDPKYMDVDKLVDEDAVKISKGIDYLLEDGV